MTDTSRISSSGSQQTAPAVSNPPEDPAFFIAKLLAGYTACGMWREAVAFLKNYNSVQGNSMGLMALSEKVQDAQMSYTSVLLQAITACQASIEAAIAVYNASGKSDDDYKTLQNTLTDQQTRSSVMNTKYNSENQFFSGLNNGINQTSADATQTESLDMQMFQQGILTLQQQLAQMM